MKISKNLYTPSKVNIVATIYNEDELSECFKISFVVETVKNYEKELAITIDTVIESELLHLAVFGSIICAQTLADEVGDTVSVFSECGHFLYEKSIKSDLMQLMAEEINEFSSNQ